MTFSVVLATRSVTGSLGGVRIAALAGGVGAARLLRGLVEVVDPAAVTAIVNTGDDVVAPRPARQPRPRHRHLHPGRRRQPGDGLGPGRARRGRPWTRSTASGPGSPGSASATATWPPTSTAPSRLGEGAPLSTVTAEIAAAWGVAVAPAAR